MASVGRSLRDGVTRGGRSDIFPALGYWVIAGMSCGILISPVLAILRNTSGLSPSAYAVLSAAMGGILGIFIGLGRAAWRAGEPVRHEHAPPAAAELWDPWLDAGNDLARTPQPHGEAEDAYIGETDGLEPAGTGLDGRAAVRPRVISPETGDGILLEDEVGLLLQAGNCPLVAIVGPPGSGKSMALRHLAAVLPPWALARVRLFDQSAFDAAMLAVGTPDSQTMTVVARHQCLIPAARTYQLAPWGQDDVIEFLQSVHRAKCASVMNRLRHSGDLGFLEGIPELWTAVLDQMARDESIDDVGTALGRALRQRLRGDTVVWKRVEDFCLDALATTAHPARTTAAFQILAEVSLGNALGEGLIHLLRHRPAGRLLAADRLASIILLGPPPVVLAARFPQDLVNETAQRLAGNDNALQTLRAWLTTYKCRDVHPMAASLLHATGSSWRPAPQDGLRLNGAYLAKICWPRVALKAVDLSGADLTDADLTAAWLDNAIADRTQFRRATLQQASMGGIFAHGADLSQADLRSVKAPEAHLEEANLSRACLVEANCWKANLEGADITDADFSGAILEDARLVDLDLRIARFDQARFGGSELRGCNLEDMELPDADFHDADCQKALFTDSRMARADFRGADLRECRLAGIDWPGACLRDADLRGANFHLGSSRDGLVGSSIACEGSRTGFYTDDYHDRDIKPAEKIRKANLRGADLRGARVDEVDFYLVDLRDARFTPEQGAHFRQCRAIMNAQV
jgi:uncharacterized protein YjbI with pentapeptide repeats/energy-coupling factor transporter ATP-binding protein EcfA2